ncbi:DUF3560 domain-containing protein [Streptomyces sp. TRM72054]|uniref:DUF3560 domain-containing protein n=1 Tax=Streptomyces sp. TRM72054 TaxID=2870562 RepID=UPI0035ABA685
MLVGHHSERRARRDQERIDNAMRKSISERDRAQHWTNREQAAANYEQFRKNPGRTLRRLDKLRADLRGSGSAASPRRGTPATPTTLS